MIRSAATYLLKRGAELTLALGLVTTCYFAILAILTFTVPQGMDLRALIRERASESAGFHTPDGAPWTGGAARRGELATLSGKTHKVKDKPATSVAWRDSEEGMKLGQRHSIQTFDGSSATIAFDKENRIELGENSLVVLNSFDREEGGADRHASLLVLGGEVRGSIRPTAGTAKLDLELRTPHGTANIRSAANAKEPAEFRFEVDDAGSSSRFSVLRGEAEVTTGGTVLPVRAHETVRMDSTGAAARPIALPAPPHLLSSPERTLPYGPEAPPVRFEWDPVPGATSYLLSIAKDPEFREVVYRTTCTATRFDYGRLGAGRYLWRVSAVAGGLEGPPSESGEVILRSDTTPPELSVAWPKGTVRASEVLIRGRTEPGVRVLVANQEVPVGPDGAFSRVVPLHAGENVIVVVAVGPVGDSAYESRSVFAK